MKFAFFVLPFLLLTILPDKIFGQVPNLGTIANYVFFTTNGAVANTGTSQTTGDIGTNNGAISGFGNTDGVISSANPSTAQGVIDLTALCSDLNSRAITAILPLAFGSGAVYTAGVYSVPGAGSIAGSITLNAAGNPNAIFIFRISGALSVAAGTTVILTNAALACNVFYIATGAAACGAGSNIKGNIIAQNAAVSIASNSTLEGRLLSTTGAIACGPGTAKRPIGCGLAVLTGPTAPVLASVACYALFSTSGVVANTGVTHINGDIGNNTGATSGFNPTFVTGSIHATPDASTATCSTDLANAYSSLNGLPFDIELLYPATFGNKLVLTPHTYRMNAAATLTDTVFLDAQGTPNAVFVIQIAGAFSTIASSAIVLMNGALATNVYWKIEGALSMATGTSMKGTVIVNGAAITSAASCLLEGRMLTTSGTVTVNSILVSKTTNCTDALVLVAYTGPAPSLGSTANFVLFNSVGAVANSGTSFITGDVGSRSAILIGFGNINGTMHNGDAATVQAVTDLTALYTAANSTASTASHGVVLGNGETLIGGVYAISAAATINGTLTLNGLNNANSVFIFKINGKYSSGASTKVVLTNGAQACNVFWVAEDSITFANATTMKGSVIAHNAPIAFSSNGNLEGRLLSTNGAITFGPGIAYNPLGCGTAALTGPTAPSLGSAGCYGIFSSIGTVSNAAGITTVNGDVGSNVGVATGFNAALITYTIHPIPDASTATCASAVNNAYTSLNALTFDIELLYPASFGNKQVLTPHTYRMNTAALLSDTLYLDAQGNASAVFVIQVNSTFTTNAAAVVRLINGALAANVYWKIDSTISIATSSILKGTHLSKSTIAIASGCLLEGRMFSKSGSITVSALAVSKVITCPPPLVVSTGPLASLGSAANFVFYTSAGAVNNTGVSTITGDVGTHLGSFTGFGAITGTFHNADDSTFAARRDLQTAYTQLSTIAPTNTMHAPAFGGGETLTSGIYQIAGAASIASDLYLDAQGDPNKAFVFQINGALAAGAGTNIHLMNGAAVCNIYWVTTGAISMGAGSTMKGSFIANNAAIAMGASGNLAGGLYSLNGAVAFGPGSATKTTPCPATVLPIELTSFSAKCFNQQVTMEWSTSSEINNDFFSLERSADAVLWKNVAFINGAGNSSTLINYSATDFKQLNTISYYRLKQTDYDGRFKFSKTIVLKSCIENLSDLKIYPNPVKNQLTLSFIGNESHIISITIYNILNEVVYYASGYQSTILFENKPNGLYFLHLISDTNSIIKKLIVENR